MQELVDRTLAAFGKIDILVCNAAINPYYGSMTGISDEQFRKILDSNIVSNHWLAQMVLPGMIDSDFNGGKTGEKGPRWALQVDELAQEIARLLTLPGHWVIDEWQAHAIGQPL